MVLFLANARRTRELLLAREVDLAVAVHEAPLAIFEKKPWFGGRFVLADLRKGSASRTRKTGSIRGARFITGDTGEEIDQFKIAYKKQWQEEPDIVVQVQSWMAATSLTQTGAGIALIPDFLAKAQSSLTIVKAPFELTPYHLNLYFRKEQALTQASESFVSNCLEAIATFRK